MADNGGFPTFAPDGTMLGNLTSNFGQTPVAETNSVASDWGTIPNYLSSIPSSFAPSQTTAGNVVASSGGTSTGGSVAATGAPANAVGTPSNAQANPATSGVTSGSIGDYFLRFVIVVLGFIFVAVGLNMFKPGLVPNPIPRGVK